MKIALALLVVVAGCLVWFAVDQPRLVSPSSENESAFLKTYSPDKVIARFKAAQFSEQALGTSGGAGRGFATHEADFEPTLVIQSKDWAALMQALRDEIDSSLTAQRGRIVEQSGNASDGFQIKYVLGKSQGIVSVEPVQSVAAASLGGVGSGPGESTVRLRICIKETWFKAGDHSERVMLRHSV